MALKQWLKTYETVTNDMKMGWNCDSNKDNCKYNMYNSAIPIGAWPHAQQGKWLVLKFRLGTYPTPTPTLPLLRGHHFCVDWSTIQKTCLKEGDFWANFFWTSYSHTCYLRICCVLSSGVLQHNLTIYSKTETKIILAKGKLSPLNKKIWAL